MNPFMAEALKEAKIALSQGNWAIGCVIVVNGKIVSRAHNEIKTRLDRTAHAELLAIQLAQKYLLDNNNKAILYTTTEPCPMCFGAIVFNRIKKVVVGFIPEEKSGAMHLRHALPDFYRRQHYEIDYTSGVNAKECMKVYQQGAPLKALKFPDRKYERLNKKSTKP